MRQSQDRTQRLRPARRKTDYHSDRTVPRTVELHTAIWPEDAKEPSRRGVVLADCGNYLGRSEGMLARDDEVAAHCEQRIEWTEIRVIDQSYHLGSMLGGNGFDRPCSFTGRPDIG